MPRTESMECTQLEMRFKTRGAVMLVGKPEKLAAAEIRLLQG